MDSWISLTIESNLSMRAQPMTDPVSKESFRVSGDDTQGCPLVSYAFLHTCTESEGGARTGNLVQRQGAYIAFSSTEWKGERVAREDGWPC